MVATIVITFSNVHYISLLGAQQPSRIFDDSFATSVTQLNLSPKVGDESLASLTIPYLII